MIYSKVQSGYPKHRCETLLVRMFDDINNMSHDSMIHCIMLLMPSKIQADNIVTVVLLDLSAAFDYIDTI